MKKILKEFLPYIIVIIIALLFKSFVATPIRVNGPSMNDTLKDKDIMILDKISYRFSDIKRFDIVVINYKDEKIIKRIIGLPGEEVKIVDNVLYINDKKIEEKYLDVDTKDFILNKKVEKDCYFVMGDNRGESMDSRMIGTIPKKDIMGKASLTILPFNRFGNKK